MAVNTNPTEESAISGTVRRRKAGSSTSSEKRIFTSGARASWTQRSQFRTGPTFASLRNTHTLRGGVGEGAGVDDGVTVGVGARVG